MTALVRAAGAATVRGLTWDHPRGYAALEAAAAEIAPAQGLAVAWDRQPLEGFESHPIADLAARFDLLVLDHPHLGEAVAAGCLVPMEEVLPPVDLAAIGAAVVGPCLKSYVYAGRTWALPLDAATQVLAARPDLLAGAPVPQTWEQVLALSERMPVAPSLAGPHAVLSLMSIAAAIGRPAASDDPAVFLDGETGRAALEVLAALDGRAPAWTRGLNPIGLLEAMAGGDGLALVPLVYGYVPYAAPADPARHRVAFHDAPAWTPGGRRGSTLGGTGLAVTRRAAVTKSLVAHLLWLMSPEAQRGYIPARSGQPSLAAAWGDPAVDAAAGGFYAGTRATIEDAFVRPRHAGFIAFQADASAIVRDGLAARRPAGAILDALQARWTESRAPGAEI